MEDVITVLNGIYSEYAGRLFSYGMQLCPDKRLVEDALQETFLDLGRHARAFSQARDKRGYLFASFRYKLLRMKKEHPEYFAFDRKHLTVEGSKALANYILEILNQ